MEPALLKSHRSLSQHISHLEEITGKKLTAGTLPLTAGNLKRISVLFDFYCSFLQNVVFYTHNNFEISFLSEIPPVGNSMNIGTLDDHIAGSVFSQFCAVRRFATDYRLDFIDFSNFHIGQDGLLTFAVSPGKKEVPAAGEILSHFASKVETLGLSEEDYSQFVSDFTPFCYRFSDFTAGIFQQYSLVFPESQPNVSIKIKTSLLALNKIIKIHFYQQYAAKDTLLLFPPVEYRKMQRYLSEVLGMDESCALDDFAGLAREFKNCKQKVSRQGVLFVSEGLDKEAQEFVHYLMGASGCLGLSFVLLGEDSSGDYDLELREKASNLFAAYFLPKEDRRGELKAVGREILTLFASLNFPLHETEIHRFLPDLDGSILESLIGEKIILRNGEYLILNQNCEAKFRVIESEEKIAFLDKLRAKDDSLALRMNHLAESGRWAEIKNLLAEYLTEGDGGFGCSGHVLLHYADYLLTDEELLRSAVEILFREGDYEKIEQLLDLAAGAEPVILILKKAHILMLRKDHQGMFRLLKTLKGTLPDHLEDEYFYLNFIYYDKISNEDRAISYRGKIKGAFFKTLADLQQATWLIYAGKYAQAEAALNRAVPFLKEKKYYRGSLQAQSLLAKLLREQGNFRDAERIYLNICVQGESLGFQLLAAYFSIDLGNLYVYQDDYARAEYWYKRSLKIFRENDNKNGIYLAKSNLMDVYKWKGHWLKVEKYFSSILEFDRERKLVEAMGVDFFNIAHLEYLKHNFSQALISVEKALKFFRQRHSHHCIIEGELLKLQILASLGKDYSLGDLDQFRSEFTHNHEIAIRVIAILKNVDLKKQRTRLFEELESCGSMIVKFELLALYHRLSNDEAVLPMLRECSLQLSDQTKNYFYYEYYYVFFELIDNPQNLDEASIDIFNEVYYFFARNKRKLSVGINRIREHLDEKSSLDDVFKSADLVGSSHRWRVPDDFFRSFLTELQKAIKVNLVKLVVFDRGEEVFRFRNTNEFDSLTGELLGIAIERAEHLALDHDDIIRLSTSAERVFYKYIHTRILLWKISETLFGGIVLGFSHDMYHHIDMMDCLSSLLKKFSPLLSRFYESDYKCNEKLVFLVGESHSIKKLKQQILKVSKVDFAVLVNGESGSGKELVARGIHLMSRRSGKPFVAVNAAAIPETLLEAELFGYVKGAFSGASDNRVGLIESADTGTLFLDEIGELPLNLQAKLLRVLQEREIRKLGANNVKTVDIRLVCATNKDLETMCKNNQFREDLFYRIQDLTLRVPPLRERMEDLPLLFRHFLEKYEFSLAETEFHAISGYWQGLEWPGNVRELESRVRRLITFYPDLGAEILYSGQDEFSLKRERETFERGLLLKVLSENGWNKIKSAEQLKISRMSLFNLLKKYNIRQ